MTYLSSEVVVLVSVDSILMQTIFTISESFFFKGAGVAIDSASRGTLTLQSLKEDKIFISLFSGLKTALVEKFDFSSGTSSRSTKLLHGGVRYLQKAVFNLDIEQVFGKGLPDPTIYLILLLFKYFYSIEW